MDITGIKSCVLQGIALTCVNLLAFIYDGQYIPFAVGVDALILGINVKDVLPVKEKKE